MAKTRRTKRNKSPPHPFGGRCARPRAFVIEKGELVTTTGVRGRTEVRRLGAGLSSRGVSALEVPPAKAVGDRKPKSIFIGRVYTGVARSKVYPYRGKKRGGGAELVPTGFMRRAARAVKSVVVKDQG